MRGAFVAASVVAVLALVGVGAVVMTKEPKRIKSLDALEPNFAARFRAFMADAAAIGIPLRVLETRRTPARQAWLYGSGRPGYTFEGVVYGRPGPILTKVSPHARATHLTGEGVDAWPVAKISATRGLVDDTETAALLKRLRTVAEKHGLANPIEWDLGHFQRA